MMVSKPCVHPEVPETGEYIRGQYESVEMVREILVDKVHADQSGSSSGSLSLPGSRSSDTEADPDNNPVEWIMVTRSDPGGTIPRWMVEKGTPKSITSDAGKFLDWASQGTGVEKKEREYVQMSIERKTDGTDEDLQSESEGSSEFEYEQEEHYGLIASVGHLLNAGLERYAPQAVLDYIPQHSRQPSLQTAESTSQVHITEEKPKVDDADETLSQASLTSEFAPEPTVGGINIDLSAAEILQRSKTGRLTSHERQLAKLAQEKRSIEARIELVRTDIQALGLRPASDDPRSLREYAASQSTKGSPASSTHKLPLADQASISSSTSPPPQAFATDNPELNKAASALFREESKLLRRYAKIERNQVKEAAKVEAQTRKEAEKREKARSKDEMDNLRKELESVKKECEKLKGERKKWLSVIGSLQAENTRLVREVEVKK